MFGMFSKQWTFDIIAQQKVHIRFFEKSYSVRKTVHICMMCQKIIFLSKGTCIHGRTAFQDKRLVELIFQKINFFISGIFDDTADRIGFSKTHGQWSMSYLMFILVDKGIFHRIFHKFSQTPSDRMVSLLYPFIRKPENEIPCSL